MVEYFTIHFPKSDRDVRIEVSRPRVLDGITFDTLYLLDGQNAFRDTHAAFGRSIRATKALAFAAKEMNKRIIGIAIHNMGSEKGRVSEYTPFHIENEESKRFESENLEVCYNYCFDFVNTLIPYIEKKYPVYKDPSHRFIYGSSLAAITALYISFTYKDTFNYIGSFSTASFLFENAFYDFLNKNIDNTKKIFLYVGKKEKSDSMYIEDTYYKSALNLYNYLKDNNYKLRFVVDPNGYHNEESWDKHLLEYINFIYSEDIIYSPK
ncbi:MAG: hypothetical protein K6E20_05780 [Acholeplasmatales bacterium]|nr:hypothetical protein [Acholeplasmatales bacterium]